MTDQDPDRKDRKHAYNRVLGIVEHNTGPPQPGMLTIHHARLVATHAGIPPEQFNAALKAAITNGDLLEWAGRVACATEDGLLGAIEDELRSAEVRGDTPRKLLVAKCNQRLKAIRGGSE